MPNPRVTVEPAEEPITLTEAKAQSRVDYDAEDTLITSYIKTARRYLEQTNNLAVISQTMEYYVDEFPSCESEIKIPIAPVSSVTSVTYTDTDGNPQTLSTSVYGADVINKPSKIYLKPNQSWPSTYDVPNAVKITFVAGWASASVLPDEIKQAVKFLTAHMIENREPIVIGSGNVVNELDFTVRALIQSYKLYE